MCLGIVPQLSLSLSPASIIMKVYILSDYVSIGLVRIMADITYKFSRRVIFVFGAIRTTEMKVDQTLRLAFLMNVNSYSL